MTSFECNLLREGKLVDGYVGIAISDHMLMVADPNVQTGMGVVAKVGVIWFTEDPVTGERIPSTHSSPSYHSPEELMATGLVEQDSFLDDDDHDDDTIIPQDETPEIEAQPVN